MCVCACVNNLPKIVWYLTMVEVEHMTSKFQIQCLNHYITHMLHTITNGIWLITSPSNVSIGWVTRKPLACTNPCHLCQKVLFCIKRHPFNGPLSGTTRVSQYQKGKTNLDLLQQEIASGSAICKSVPCSRQITMPAPHDSHGRRKPRWTHSRSAGKTSVKANVVVEHGVVPFSAAMISVWQQEGHMAVKK